MEISASAVTGSLRVGLQVISNHKKPLLEIYHQVCNRMGPEQEFDMPVGINGNKTRKEKHRFQDVFVMFTLVNIGGVRAEDVTMMIEGELKRRAHREDFGGIFKASIPQFAPGQTHFLFSFTDSDLWNYSEVSNKPNGLKEGSFTITMSYNPPSGWLTTITALPWKILGKKRYISKYTFSTKMVAGELPPVEYVG